MILAVTIEERKGSFLRFCRALGKRNITEFNYRLARGNEAHIYVGLQVATEDDKAGALTDLNTKGYTVLDMTDNEAAKLHVRHMVGGRIQGETEEALFRFEFPERPGALLQFLTGVGANWNITLFHYRNHGSAYGRVLVGFAATKRERPKLARYLKEIGYRFWEEDNNPAYQMFLK